MYKTMLTLLVLVAVSSLVLIAGCETEAQNASLTGAAIGAGVGQLAGRDTESTLIGSAVGAGAGYIIGNEQDKKKREAQIAQVRAEQNTRTVWITNSNGSKISVPLTRQGPGYLGPRGEYYEKLPTEDDLRPVYGF